MDLADLTARIRHDLGKYVCFAARFLDDDAPADALREALADDLLHTRRGASGAATVREVWAELAAGLHEAGPLPVEVVAAVRAIDADVAALAAGANDLDGLDLDRLRALAARARALADRTRALDRLVRGGGPAAGGRDGGG